MKRAVAWVLALGCLLWGRVCWAQQDVGARDQALRDAVRAQEGRAIRLEAFETDPATGARCAFFVAAGGQRVGDSVDFAFWFMQEGAAPDKVFEGAQQPPPEEEWDDDRVYPREYLQGFAHGGHAYFIASACTGQRQSDYSMLYMADGGRPVPVQGFYGAGAGYHPDVGLYGLDYDYATEPGIEAGRALTPVFYALEGGRAVPAAGTRMDWADLRTLANGGQLESEMNEANAVPESLYYLPNHMAVVNYSTYNHGEEMQELTHVYVGIDGGRGALVRCPDQLEQPDVSEPFWRVCATAAEAAQDGWYRPWGGEGAVTASALFAPRADRMMVYGAASAPAAAPQKARSYAFLPSGSIQDKIAQLFMTAQEGRATPEQIRAMADIVNAADPKTRALFERTLGLYRIGLLRIPGVFSPKGDDLNENGVLEAGEPGPNTVSLDIAADEARALNPWYTFFHEAGHAIDAHTGPLDPDSGEMAGYFSNAFVTDTTRYDRVTLEEAARQDVAVSLREAAAKFTSGAGQADLVFRMLWSKYPQAAGPMDVLAALQVKAYYNYLFQGVGYTVSDIFGAVTNNRIYLTLDEIDQLNFVGVLINVLDKVDALNLLDTQAYLTAPVGHLEDGYWYKAEDAEGGKRFSRTGNLAPELFAGYFSSRIRGAEEELRCYRFFLPEAVQVLEQMLDPMLAVAGERGPQGAP